ncbi:MAG: orotidine-5'-phosphate decarboxylase [Thermoleophilia bacterium]|nr:orotidine-5'-phosphate decarboxylase [Thermoleophilia bacterium]
MDNFADRLTAAMLGKRSQLCVGLDPRVSGMPATLVKKHRAGVQEGGGSGRQAVAACFEEFCYEIIEAVSPHAAAVKIQLACFEPYGPPGMRAFQHVCDLASEAGLIVIADAKRGDIAISAQAYSAAYLGRAEGLNGPVRPLRVDAMTVNPLFGTDGVAPFLEDCRRFGKGIFVLVKTSNPGSVEFQDLHVQGDGLFYEQVAARVDSWGEGLAGESGYSSVGAVIGATQPDILASLRETLPRAVFLVPGAGAQGAGAAEAAAAFDKKGLGALITASRSIIYAGGGGKFAARAAEAARRMQQELWSSTH